MLIKTFMFSLKSFIFSEREQSSILAIEISEYLDLREQSLT